MTSDINDWIQERFEHFLGDPSAHPIDWCTDINRKEHEDYLRENGDDDDDACNGFSGMNEEDYEDYMDDLDQNSSDEEEEETFEQEPAVQATAAPQVSFFPHHQTVRRDRDENKENEKPEEEN
jgi:hypothetical protein